MNLLSEEIEAYCHAHTSAEPILLQQVAQYTKQERNDSNMLTGRVEGRFLKMLVAMLSAKRVLEVGTYTGYSALSMAEGLPPDGEILTCELNEENATTAQGFFEKSEHGKKIKILRGPALESIAKLNPPFDLAFIDADKRNYPNYYEAALTLLRSGGIIAVDNTLWRGEVLNPQKADAEAIANLNARVVDDPRVECVLLSVRDGINLIRKR